MHGRFGAPLLGKSADGLVNFLIEAQEVTDHPTVEQGAVGVSVREVGGLQRAVVVTPVEFQIFRTVCFLGSIILIGLLDLLKS